MDRHIYKVPFTRDSTPDWPCPRCKKGLLRFVDDRFFSEERKDSKIAHGHDSWDPDWIEYVYSALLKCTKKDCGEFVSSTGTGGLEYDLAFDGDEEPEQTWQDVFLPRYFEPPLEIINIPDECPSAIAEPLRESFRLFFASPTAASNRVRIALEALLTELGVKRFSVKNGKRTLLTLHSRIRLLPPKHAGLQDLFIAIKWLGNTGSHANSAIKIDDVMDAYELVDHILQEVYTQRSKKLKALARNINKKRGPKK